MYRTNRVSYYLTKGDIPEGMIIMHTCDNPRCVKPDHLKLGTHKDNTQDMIAKGRHKRACCLGQARGARTKRERTFKNTMPFVLCRVREIISNGEKATLRRCSSIPGYNAILGHYLRHNQILSLARRE